MEPVGINIFPYYDSACLEYLDLLHLAGESMTQRQGQPLQSRMSQGPDTFQMRPTSFVLSIMSVYEEGVFMKLRAVLQKMRKVFQDGNGKDNSAI